MVPADPEGDGDPPPRICPALAYDAGREVTVLFGGQAADHGHLGDTWEWDGTSWHRRCDGLPAGDTCRRQPPRRWRHGLAYDGGRRRVVLYGGDGDDGRGILGGTWEWDGRDWTPIIPDDPEGDGDPSPRSSASLAYHGARGGVVLYGGADDAGATADIIWVWDGWSWARTGPVDPERDGDPPAYDEPALCYDSATRRTVLWSRGSSGSLEGPWDWDGVSWALGAPEDPEGDGGPARRFERRRCRLDYDSVRARTVLFSGAFPSVATWEWNGESWAMRAPADPEQDGNPSPRQAFAVVFDSQRGQLVLFGGWHEDEPFGDTWEWDGTSWALRAPADPEGDGEPPGRAGHALAFDSRRSVVVLFGGTPDWDQPLDDTWEWDGGATSRPGQTLHVSLAAAALPPSPVWETLTATLLAGGRGHADGVQHGAELHLWDEGRWRRVGRNDRPPDDPGPLEWTTADPDLVRRLLFGQDQSVNLAVLPLAPNGTGTASVAVDYAEVRVRYRLSP